MTYMSTAVVPTYDACSYKIVVPQGLFNDEANLSITFTKLDNINAYLNVGQDFNFASSLEVVPDNAAAVVDTIYTIPYKSISNLLITVTPVKDQTTTALEFKFKVDGTEN